jgi:taurine--2-oxoglutarate transaminase
MAVNLGHGNRQISEAMADQARNLAYVSPAATVPIRDQLAGKMAEIAPPGLNRVLFTTGGAESIENAIKLARLATGRHKVVTKYRSYHGATSAAIAASGDPRRHSQAAFEPSGIVRIEAPYCTRCPWHQVLGRCDYECSQHLERIIEFEGPHTIAAILLEGESGTSGCIKYPPEYWKRARELATRYGIVLISDEVMSGFGRCGDWFAVSRYGVVPDIITMAKGLTSGYIPMGGVLLKDSLISPKFKGTMLPVGLTYAAHPVGCAAAVSAITQYQENDLVTRAVRTESLILQSLINRLSGIACVLDIRLTGYLGVVELCDPGTRLPLSDWAPWIMDRLSQAGLVGIVRWNYLFFAPPLIAEEVDILWAITQIGAVLDELVATING